MRSARTAADLSLRSLAERAGVASSTVARIESGRVDPTTGMLARLLAASGCELDLVCKPYVGPEIADLASAWWADDQGVVRPNWNRIRGLLEHLALHPDAAGPATLRRPRRSGSALVDNLLAGMAEKTCDDAGLPRPPWTHRVRPLRKGWVQPGTRPMREAARASTPPQLLARNLILAASNLWPEGTTVEAPQRSAPMNITFSESKASRQRPAPSTTHSRGASTR